MRPAYQFKSALPLPLDPANKVFAGALKVPSQIFPKTPSLSAGATTSGSQEKIKEKKVSTPEVVTTPPVVADKKKGKVTDSGKKRKSSKVPRSHAGEPGAKKLREDNTAIIVTGPAPPASSTTPAPASSLPLNEYLAELPSELQGDFQKHLQEIIPDSEKGKGVVWKSHLAKDYPDSLGVYYPGYLDMQTNLTPSVEARIHHAREAFRLTSSAEERKVVTEDTRGALGLAMHYQHHTGVILGSLWDKYEREAMNLEAPPPGVPLSTAAIIEREFYKDQMLSRNRLANIRLEEIRADKKEIENYKGTLLKQQAALVQKEEELAKACNKIADMEKELANRNNELEKMIKNAKQIEEEVAEKTLSEFLSSDAFTHAADRKSVV